MFEEAGGVDELSGVELLSGVLELSGAELLSGPLELSGAELEELLEELPAGFSGTGCLTCSSFRPFTIELAADESPLSSLVVVIMSVMVESTSVSKSEFVFLARFLQRYAFA